MTWLLTRLATSFLISELMNVTFVLPVRPSNVRISLLPIYLVSG